MSHIDDTSQLTRKLLLYMDLGLANNEIQLIAEAAKYHDIGKIYIPDHILYKPGELTKEEYKIVQQHTVIGHDMIMNSNLNRELKKYAAEIALHHHERIDGSGYPDNLLGKEIKDWIQVVALADVYTALRSKRVYKPAYSKEKAVQNHIRWRLWRISQRIFNEISRVFDKKSILETRKVQKYSVLF